MHNIKSVMSNTDMSTAMGVDDPRIVQVAKLAIILASTDTDLRDKYLSIKLAIKQGVLTEEDGAALLAYRLDLEDFAAEVRILE